MKQLTSARFLNEVKDHKLTVLRDDGVYRHIRLSEPGTVCMHFDLITWPGYLCYTGDMGTFVFQRVADMFSFFRSNKGFDAAALERIDHSYWAEKLQGTDRNDGAKEFDESAFRREITEQRRRLFTSHAPHLDAIERQTLWDELGEVMASAEEGEHRTISAVQDWSFGYYRDSRRVWVSLETCEFPSCKTYTHRFLWCCMALRWGIGQYDTAKTQQLEAA